MRNDEFAVARSCASGDFDMSGQNDRQALERFTCFGQHLIRAVRLDRPETPDPLDLGRLQDWKDLVASGFSDRLFCRRHARTREAALSLL